MSHYRDAFILSHALHIVNPFLGQNFYFLFWLLHFRDVYGIMRLVMIMSFSEKLANAMKDRQMSTRQLSELTGIPKSAIQRYTSGETEKIPIDRMIRMAEAMGIDPAFVMGWASDSTAEISKALGSDSPAAKNLRAIGDQLAPSPLLKEIGKALGSDSPAAKKLQEIKRQFKSPMIDEMVQAMQRMTLKEQKKMVEMGRVLFPERFKEED